MDSFLCRYFISRFLFISRTGTLHSAQLDEGLEADKQKQLVSIDDCDVGDS